MARIAAIGAAKRTDELIPLCHSLPLDHVKVQFSWPSSDEPADTGRGCRHGSHGCRDGSVGRRIAGRLTVIDMCKALDKSIVIENLQLVSKTGGASGDYQRVAEKPDGPGHQQQRRLQFLRSMAQASWSQSSPVATGESSARFSLTSTHYATLGS